jgi:hypothetical protein
MSMRGLVLGVVLMTVLGSHSHASAGVDASAELQMNVYVQPAAFIALTPSTVNFFPTDPALPTPSDNPVVCTVRIFQGTAGQSTVTAQADGDLIGTTGTILCRNVTWHATGAGFVDGFMCYTTPQPVASFTGPGTRTGTLSFTLAAGDYAVDSYHAKAQFLLTVL